MEFTSMEKQAVISLMIGIIEADGWIDDEEIEFAQDVLDAIECTEEDFDFVYRYIKTRCVNAKGR